MAGRRKPAARRIKLVIVDPEGREPGQVIASCPDCVGDHTREFVAIFGGEPGWGAPSISEHDARAHVRQMILEHAAESGCNVVA